MQRAGAPTPRGQRGRLPPLPVLYGGARGQRNALYYNTSHIIHQKSKSIEDSASISHNTDLVKLSEIIDLQELTSEAQELPVYLNLHNRNSAAPITKVTKVSTFCDVMNSVSDSKDCLPHIHQLLKHYMSVPLGSATAGRTFSVMRRVKSWLRSSMSSNTSTGFSVSYTNNELTKWRRKRWPKSCRNQLTAKDILWTVLVND